MANIKGFFCSIVVFFIIINSSAKTDIGYQDKLNDFSENTFIELPKPTQGLLDKNEYQFIQLENGLRVLLISDKSALTSMVSMNVNAGGTQDPNNRPGLAHCLEHMLLIASKKYPIPNNFANLITKNNGYKNASTDLDNTNYYYRINPSSLEKSLDRFSQLFICPSLDLKYIEKERNAINSEHQNLLINDTFIIERAMNTTANANNPSNKFFVGDLTTLHNKNNSLYPELKSFFDRYYVANNMTLVVCSNHSINMLKKLVIDKFSTIKPGIKTEDNKELYLKPNQQGLQINIQTVNDIDYLIMEFYIPFNKKNQFSPVFEYIHKFLSPYLFNPLKDKGLISDERIFYSSINNNYLKYKFYFYLTKEGAKNIEEIPAIFFDAIYYIKQHDIDNSLVDYLKKREQKSFDFYKKPLEIDDIRNYAKRMTEFSYEHILDAHYYYDDDLNVDFLNSILDNLTWKNLRLIVAGNKVLADTKIDFCNSKYKILPFSENLINRLETHAKEPYFIKSKPNIFLTNDLSIKHKPEYKSPKKIVDDLGITSWYMPDNQFNLPHGNINILISNNTCSQSAEYTILNKMYVDVIRKLLQEQLKLAEKARINSNIDLSLLDGVTIEISGLQDKQFKILELYMQALKHPYINKTDFTIIKQKIIAELTNKQFLQPYDTALSKFKEVILPNIFSVEQLIAATESLTIEDLEKFFNDYSLQINIQMLVYGNYTENEAYDITETIKTNFLTNDNAINKSIKVKRSIDSNVVFSTEVNNNNSCCVNYYPVIINNFNHSAALACLTSQLLKESFFKQLRTEEQIGYAISNNMFIITNEPWVSFSVQSDVQNPEYISKRIAHFLVEQIVELENMSNEEFNLYKNNLIKKLSQPPLTQQDAVNDIWTDIIDFSDNLPLYYHMAQALKDINKQDIIDLVKSFTTQDNSISIQLWGNQDKLDKENADQNQNALTTIKQLDKFPVISY